MTDCHPVRILLAHSGSLDGTPKAANWTVSTWDFVELEEGRSDEDVARNTEVVGR